MSDSPRAERRRQGRRAVTDAAGWFRLGADFQLIDVSLDGIGVESTVPLQIGRVYTGTVEWEGERIQVTGRVAWSALVRTAKGDGGDVVPIYHAGIHFVEPADAALAERRRLIAHATTYRPGDRLFGRYEALPEHARLQLDSAFRVRKLSRRGMLIETAEPLEIEAVLDLDLDLDGSNLRCRGRVASREEARESEGQMVHPAGIEFVDLGGGAGAVLEAYLAALEPQR